RCSTERARGHSAWPWPLPNLRAAEPGLKTVLRAERGRVTVSPAQNFPIRTTWCQAPGSTCRGSRNWRDQRLAVGRLYPAARLLPVVAPPATEIGRASCRERG